MKFKKLPFLLLILHFPFITGYHAFASIQARLATLLDSPAAPYNLEAESKNDKIKLTWDVKAGGDHDEEEDKDEDEHDEDRYIVSDNEIEHIIIERSDNSMENFRSLKSVKGKSRKYDDKEIQPNNTYYYRVLAVNDEGTSGYSNVASATTQQEATPPATPTGLTASAASATSINLSWNDNSKDETGFVIQRSASAESGFATIAEPAANVTSYTDTGLLENTPYYYRVYAVNAVGNSGFSNTASATTQQEPVPPATPTGLAASAASTTSISLSWNDNSEDETGFVIQRSASAESGFLTVAEPAANLTSYTNTGLTENTTYYYRVYAMNAAGNSGFSNTASATTQQEANPPTAPTGLAASAASTTSISLSWNDNAEDETGFVIQRSASAESGFATVAEPGANATSYTDTELSENTTYYYRVYAVNTAGNSGFSNTASATTQQDDEDDEDDDTGPPAAPTGLSASVASTTSINLSWDDNAEDETGYVLQRSTSAESGFTNIAEPKANTTSHTDTGLSENTTYYYRIYAINEEGNSQLSNTASATTEQEQGAVAPAAPTNLSATAASASSIDLAWTDNAGNEESYIIQRSATSGSGFSEVAILVADANRYTDKDLSASTTYYYRVFASNEAGNSDPSNEASAQTMVEIAEIAAPSELTGVASSVTEIVLNWTDNSDNEANFELSRTSGEEVDFNTVAVLTSNTNTYIDLDLRPNTTYTYRIRAMNGDSFSEFSNEVSVSTHPEVAPQIEVLNKNFPQFFDMAEKNAKASIELSDADHVEKVLVYHRGIRGSKWTSEALASASTAYEFPLNATLLDELGVEYYFQITNVNGEQTISDVGITYLAYPGEGLVMENLKNGDKQSAYQMISIPLQLDNPDMGSVFNDDLGAYNIDNWRLARHQGGELVENGRGLNIIEPGKGYWLIIKENTSVSTGKGHVVQASKELPFRIALRQGWNQIGNPYPFDIQWTEVLAYNGNPAIGNLVKFDNGYKETDVLSAYRGAYVFSETDMEISIPVNDELNIQKEGRMIVQRQQPQKGVWDVGLQLSSPELTYSLGGFGMHPNASKSKDRFDRVSLPRHFDYVTVSFEHQEYFLRSFTKDIVPEAESQVWAFTIASNKSIPALTLQWDKPAVEGKNLILYDVVAQKSIDMLQEGSYRIALEKNRDFKVYYGDEEFIEKTLKPHKINMGEVFPNPFEDNLQVPFTLPDSKKVYEVAFEIYNELGQLIRRTPSESFPAGFHKASLELPNTASAGKMYFLKFYVKSGNKLIYSSSEKIIKRR